MSNASPLGMRDVWERLERWFQERAEVSIGLRPGASEDTIAAAESTIGRRLPEDVRESLAVHDGHQANPAFTFLPGGMTLYSAAEIAEQWEALKQFSVDDEFFLQPATDRRLRNAVYDPRRIPIAHSELATAWIFLDYFPGPDGAAGQLIHNTSECDFCVLALDLRTLLTNYVELLEAGELVWLTDDRYSEAGFVVPAGSEASFPEDRVGEFLASRCPAPSSEPATSPRRTWCLDDSVRLLTGAYAGMTGTVVAVKDGTVRVSVAVFGRPVTVDLRAGDLERS
ncbi:SMI1/KNR4 family protein [Planctomycetota bacterium]|nr:SMI1/KNR4 family protein [Planctomycetota bacterium]